MARSWVPEHPSIQDALGRIRDEAVGTREFRQLVRELGAYLVYEAVRDWPTSVTQVRTPLGVDAETRRWLPPGPVVVPVLRAGLGMLEGALRAIPEAEVGVIGLKKDPVTFQADLYCAAVPSDLSDRRAIVLDPMIATGNTMSRACSILIERRCSHVTAVCLIAAPEGLAKLQERCPQVDVVAAAVDPSIDSRAFIVPGLGDAGDRLYGPP